MYGCFRNFPKYFMTKKKITAGYIIKLSFIEEQKNPILRPDNILYLKLIYSANSFWATILFLSFASIGMEISPITSIMKIWSGNEMNE